MTWGRSKGLRMERTGALDYLGHPINVGDRVIFPAGADQMEGTVVKFTARVQMGPDKGKILKMTVKNDSGYSKSKYCAACINVSLIRDSLPEYQL